ncbi:hypothetical protein PF002_g5816 [Phytophthora fragariae]|uniref:Uncharacterized protein n=1 Tax=Phytophthora fragariae TaxID=53985 RepID=A0A6A4A3F5_9STRA|nr:hypothetical protein PF002_g5816 [Phytophthora fragariae]
MKAGYDGSFRQESMAFSSPEVIVIDDSSDDEEQVLAFPSEERPVKSEFYDPLPGSRAKKRQRELFRSSVGPFSDGKAAAALALKSRHAKRAPPPTRLNSTIRKVAVRRNSDSVGDLPVTPSPPPDAKAMIQSSPISKFAEATRSLTAQATAAAPAKIFVDAPWPPRDLRSWKVIITNRWICRPKDNKSASAPNDFASVFCWWGWWGFGIRQLQRDFARF